MRFPSANAAVVAATGDSWDQWSQLDWAPIDDDEERPDDCARFITMFPDRPDCDWPTFWRITAQLGVSANLMVIVQAKGVYVCVDTQSQGWRRVSVNPETVEHALTVRISRAIAVLDGMAEVNSEH